MSTLETYRSIEVSKGLAKSTKKDSDDLWAWWQAAKVRTLGALEEHDEVLFKWLIYHFVYDDATLATLVDHPASIVRSAVARNTTDLALVRRVRDDALLREDNWARRAAERRLGLNTMESHELRKTREALEILQKENGRLTQKLGRLDDENARLRTHKVVVDFELEEDGRLIADFQCEPHMVVYGEMPEDALRKMLKALEDLRDPCTSPYCSVLPEPHERTGSCPGCKNE